MYRGFYAINAFIEKSISLFVKCESEHFKKLPCTDNFEKKISGIKPLNKICASAIFL